MKYYLMRLESLFEITRFPLFQNVNRNFFHLKYEQQAQFFKNISSWITEREECMKF